MNILFLTLLDFNSLKLKSIYTDLLREFIINGHYVYTISPVERRNKRETKLILEDHAQILKLRIGNITKTDFIEKGVATTCIEYQYIAGIKKYFSNVKFDIVIYSTPPITFYGAINFVKNRDGAKSYLLLKDIFPQNTVDIGKMTKSGPAGLIYKYFRNKEKKLYQVSDYIGCMSQANVDYIIANNLDVNPDIVEICPNSIEVEDMSVDVSTREAIRYKYGIPQDKKVFIYGGNLGVPQGIDFMIKCLESQEKNNKVFFIIVGNGTEFSKIENYIELKKPKNIVLWENLPKEEYDRMVGACDVGMIFIDHRFTIPNFPSRLLSYMQAKLPVVAVTDPNTDIGKVIEKGGFGWWVESNDVGKFDETIRNIISKELDDRINSEWDILNTEYNVKKSYKTIMRHFS